MESRMTDTSNNSQAKKTGMFLCILFTGIGTSFLYYSISTALPSIMEELAIDLSSGHWLTSGYSYGMGLSILLNAYLSKRFPAKNIYLTALIFLLTGTGICRCSGGFYTLLAGRITQAVGNGLTIALGQQVLFEMYTKKKKGWIMGWYGFSICCS